MWVAMTGLAYLFPGGGEKGPLGLSFFNVNELWTLGIPKPENAGRTDSLIQDYTNQSKLRQEVRQDSLLALPEIDLTKKGFLNADIPTELLAFFQALDSVQEGKMLRIAHYGDSQIEGDRVTAHLRNLFQSNFGGRGTGFIPFADPASVWAYARRGSENWKRHSVFQNKLASGLYGISGAAFRFVRVEMKDSVAPDSFRIKVIDGSRANLNFQMVHGSSFEKVRLAYAAPTVPVKMTIISGDTSKNSINLSGTERWNEQTLPLPAGNKEFKLEFESDNSPVFYGIYADNEKGVQVDNYAIRGHTGDGLLQIPQDILSGQAVNQNIKLFIFQFGNNAIPFLDSIGECKYFEQVYYRIFSRFRQLAPQASVLVIGVGDMLTRVQGQEVTWPLLKEFRDAQKRAALRAGCAFWDLFEAMGGERSLLAWHEKKLAAKDGHLSPGGQELIAAKIHEDLMAAYIRYKNSK